MAGEKTIWGREGSFHTVFTNCKIGDKMERGRQELYWVPCWFGYKYVTCIWALKQNLLPVLEPLFWLPLPFWEQFKILVLVLGALCDLGQGYLQDLLLPYIYLEGPALSAAPYRNKVGTADQRAFWLWSSLPTRVHPASNCLNPVHQVKEPKMFLQKRACSQSPGRMSFFRAPIVIPIQVWLFLASYSKGKKNYIGNSIYELLV